MKKCFVALVFLVYAMPVAAESIDAQSLVKKLSLCNADFFHEVKNQKVALNPVGNMGEKDKVAFFKVADRSVEGKNAFMFLTPISLGKYSIVGYFDELSDLQEAGKYYSWGFLVKGDLQGVVSAIKPYLHEANRLRNDGGVYVRSEIGNSNDATHGWSRNDALKGGTVPAKGMVERVLLVEPAGEGQPDLIRVGCSLQGEVTPELLGIERPDVDR